MEARDKWGGLQRRIVLLLFLAITINVLDRQVLSLVAPVLRDQLHLSNTQYGEIVFAFLLGMAVGQVPVGVLIDRIGARKGLALIATWWSAANLAHAFLRSVAQFSVMRFLLGFGECGNYSAGIKVIGQWFAPKDRALAGGIFNGGALAGAIIAPPLVTYLVIYHGWRAAFLLPSMAGALWVLPWIRTYREPAVEVEQHEEQASVPLAGRALWGVTLMRTFGAPVGHFYWYWLPEYLKHGRGMSLEAIGLTAWMPFLAGGAGNVGGGWLSRVLIGRGWSVGASRTLVFTAATVVSLTAVLVPAASGPAWALALLCAASLAINAYAANLIGLITDLFPHHMLARVTGWTGVGDNVMSMVAMLATGVVVDRFSYTPVFIAAGLLPVLGLGSYFVLVRRGEGTG